MSVIDILNIVCPPLVVAHLYVYIMMQISVRGSYKRYVYANLTITITTGVILLFAAMGVSHMTKNTGIALLDGVIVLIDTWALMNLLKDEDNWFNNQFKKLRRVVKNLRDQLASVGRRVQPAYT